jgi:hypothetical protein
MSTYAGELYNPTNGFPQKIYSGFSWPCLLLGFFWYLYKSMYIWAAVAFFLALLSGGFSWFIFPFFANAQHLKMLREAGYMTAEEIETARALNGQASSGSSTPIGSTTTLADELGKLSALHNSGAITDEEFSTLKTKLM